ncbi:DoxX family membrane protein [Arthrobacter sp. NPDC056691]|uniref:DoxX family membrane protein n=1 Tax=Arthrobacter sp. NPDC056691 TaxID=3345913 RepID=UPI00366E64BA
MKTLLRGGGLLVRFGGAAEARLVQVLRLAAMPSLRFLLGVVFMWFGALKVAGVSPVAGMVAGTLPWADPHVVVTVLGGVEVLLGVLVVTGIALRLALPVLAAHLCGTFLTFVMLPGLMFTQGDPLLLTADGEFVMKNLVLIGATLALIAHCPARSRNRGPAQPLTARAQASVQE